MYFSTDEKKLSLYKNFWGAGGLIWHVFEQKSRIDSFFKNMSTPRSFVLRICFFMRLPFVMMYEVLMITDYKESSKSTHKEREE